MGMLMHHTWQEQQKNKPVEPAKAVKEEEIPFTEPEEQVEEKPVRKTTATTRRRKNAK